MATGVALRAPFPPEHSGDLKELPCLAQSSASRPVHEMRVQPTNLGIPGNRQRQATSSTAHLSVSEKGGDAETAMAPYLQIPSSINSSKGSLAEFAAQIACLFWFQATSKLNMIESGLLHHATPRATASESVVPANGFRKWVITMLSTTQVSQNVILLALLFIFRLKTSNPSVKGRRGSEFRLMTIALMMGNKFLDDTTYTNKTWADVSGISIQEIHVMEVEFLSNIRYNLWVSQEEWNDWHVKLGVFSNYLDWSSRARHNGGAGTKAISSQQSYRSMPAPSSADYIQTPQLPPTSAPPAPTGLEYATRRPRNQTMTEQQFPLPADVSSESLDPLSHSRKRRCDGELDLQPAKRVAAANPIQGNTFFYSGSTPWRYPIYDAGRRSTSQSAAPTTSMPNPAIRGMIDPNPSSLQLGAPPLDSQSTLPPNGAMSMPYSAGTTWCQSSYVPATLAPVPAPGSQDASANVANVQRNGLHLASSSLPPYPVRTPLNLSPSAILDRNSPYRPVRGVNTLLYPPPSSSLHPPRKLSVDEIHYQPLSKAAREQKSGVLPYYQGDPWTHSFAPFNYAGPPQNGLQG